MTKKIIILANAILLLACVSMYFGTGWSLLLFNLAIESQLTVSNYYTHLVPQITAATEFFTQMTKVMFAAATILIILEWKQRETKKIGKGKVTIKKQKTLSYDAIVSAKVVI